MRIVIKRGLDIPFAGKPTGPILALEKPSKLSLNLDPFDDIRFKLQVKVGDEVKIGEPLAENKSVSGQMFVSPAGGKVSEIRRGLKRRLLDVVIDVAEKEEFFIHEKRGESKEEILDLFLRAGIFPHIRLRPFNLVANPQHLPRAIFVRALESRPLTPDALWQLEGQEKEFKKGIETLSKIAPIHLILREKTDIDVEGVEKHTVKGPHPSSNPSIHIHHILPILKANDYTWTIDVEGVVTIGRLMLEGTYYVERIISVGGNGVKDPSFYKGRMGFPLKDLLKGKIEKELICLISGDPLTGTKVELEDFLGFYHTAVCVLPINVKREFFHFWRMGRKKYSATRAYLSGFLKQKSYPFTTNQHGEGRTFIDGNIYNKVMPMRISTMPLIKALLAQDYELAEILGVYEVAPEDFALPAFICPSKIEMMDIVKNSLYLFSKEMGY